MPYNRRAGQSALKEQVDSDNMVLIHSLMALCEESFDCENCHLPCRRLYDRFCGRCSQGASPNLSSLEVLRFVIKFSDLIKPKVNDKENGG